MFGNTVSGRGPEPGNEAGLKSLSITAVKAAAFILTILVIAAFSQRSASADTMSYGSHEQGQSTPEGVPVCQEAPAAILGAMSESSVCGGQETEDDDWLYYEQGEQRAAGFGTEYGQRTEVAGVNLQSESDDAALGGLWSQEAQGGSEHGPVLTSGAPGQQTKGTDSRCFLYVCIPIP